MTLRFLLGSREAGWDSSIYEGVYVPKESRSIHGVFDRWSFGFDRKSFGERRAMVKV